MQSIDILQWIIALESKYDVDQWVIKNIHIWPIIRIRLYYKCMYEQTELKPATSSRAINSILKNYLNFIKASIYDKKNSGTAKKKGGALLLSNGVSYYKTSSGCYYDKFCDPVIETLKKKNIHSHILTPLHEYKYPRFSEGSFIQPFLDFNKISYYRYLLTHREKDIHFRDELQQFIDEVTSVWTFKNAYTLNEILKDVYYIYSTSRTFKSYLKKFKPSTAFSVCYYSANAMALNIACNELNIPSVDIQHGVQFDAHIAYGHWTKVPQTGYAALPRYFWCWSQDEADVINEWNEKLTKHHQAVITGNLWLEQWRTEAYEWLKPAAGTIELLNKNTAGTFNILITLQPIFSSPNDLAILLECIKNSKPNWQWWIRLHPLMLDKKEQIKMLFSEHTAVQIEIEDASSIELFTLLKKMDAHITHSSATVLEALEFDIPSIVFSQMGKDLYERKINNRQVFFSNQFEDILNHLELLQEGRLEITLNHKRADEVLINAIQPEVQNNYKGCINQI